MAKLWFPSDFCKAFGSTLASGSCLPTSLNQSNHPFKKWKNATNRGASDSWHPIYIFIGYVQGWSPLEALVHTPTHLCVCIRHSKELKPLPLIHPHVSVMGSELSMNHHQLAEPNSKCPSVEAEFQNENSARNILLVIFFFSELHFSSFGDLGWLACGLDWSGFDALLLWTLTLNLSLKPFEI